jgi:hypothetical protein
MMKFKFKRKHLDSLYWIFPVLFMGLALVAISRDRHNHRSGIRTVAGIKSDTSLTDNSGWLRTDSLTTHVYVDGTSKALAP